MTDKLTEHHVRPLLHHLLPSAIAATVADWVKDKNFRVASLDSIGHDGIREMGSNDREALGDEVYGAYCKAQGVVRVYAPENLTAAINLVAKRFHFADGEAMREYNESLYSNVYSRLETFSWRNQYLVRQTLDDKDIGFAVNTWFKVWSSAWTENQTAFWLECQDKHIQKTSKTYTPGELFESVQEFMAAHPGQEYTYNQVSDGLQIANTRQAIPQRMSVKDALERLSNPKQNVYDEVVRFATRLNKKGAKSATVYTWAPRRRVIDRNPILRGGIIKDVILEFVGANPDCTSREIRAHVRAALGQIANPDVDLALKSMIGDLLEKPAVGPNRSFLHRVKSKPFVKNDRPLATNGVINWD